MARRSRLLSGSEVTKAAVRRPTPRFSLVAHSSPVASPTMISTLPPPRSKASAGGGSITTLALLTNAITGVNPLTWTDVTPIAQLFTDYVVHAVRADSPIRSVKDLLERLKADPQSVSVSLGSARGSTPHFNYALVAKTGGVDPRRLKVVTFGGAAESVTNLLGGHIDMTAGSVDNMIPHLRSGAVRVLGISGAQRSVSLPEVPTLKEQGIDVELANWRGVFAPPGVSDAQRAAMSALVEKMAASPQWKEECEKRDWIQITMMGDAYKAYIESEFARIGDILKDLGLA